MDYEKLYKEALERARQVHTTNVDENKKSSEYIFPELKESEDERIRKKLVRAFESLNTIKVWNGIERTDILAWLEKQGEKPTMKVKEAWKEMRFEVYAQASGNRHQPNCSDNSTKMFSLNDISEIIECINEKTTNLIIEYMETNEKWYIRGKKGCAEQIRKEFIKRGANDPTLDKEFFGEEEFIYYLECGLVRIAEYYSMLGERIVANWEEVKVGKAKPKHTFKPYGQGTRV